MSYIICCDLVILSVDVIFMWIFEILGSGTNITVYLLSEGVIQTDRSETESDDADRTK